MSNFPEASTFPSDRSMLGHYWGILIVRLTGPTRVSSWTGGPAVGAGTEGLAEGPLSGDERTLTECNATSQFDPN